MTAFSQQMQTLATNLITEFGESVSFSRTTEGAYNTSTGATASATTTTFTGVGVPTEYTNREIDGTLVQAGDIKLTVAKTSSVPETGDIVTVSSTDYRVQRVMFTRVSGEDIIYDLQLRL